MHFDATGKYIRRSDMLKSHNFVRHDIMNEQNRPCKGRCIQFKARKPPVGGRYEFGQYRCQTCEIYLTEQGVDGNSCKCCNMRVRGKPRNSMYKEKYHEKIRNTNDPWIATEENNDAKEFSNKVEDDYTNEKKSTPIYDEIDESVKTYYEFKEFLDSIKLQTNYQLVILKELLEYGKLHKGEIAESLAYFNNKDTRDIEQVKYFLNRPVCDVLLKHGFIAENEGSLPIPYYTLNVVLEDFQKIELVHYLTDEIARYNKEHRIPENEFPNANNMKNIDWAHSDFQNKPNVQKIKNFVKKTHLTPPNSHWIWSVTPENWKIVKSNHIWGSRNPKDRIGSKVKPGDQVAFYVIGNHCFKGIFEFVGEWYDSPGKTWDDDLEPSGSLRYKSQIKLTPIQLGSTSVFDLYEKMELFREKSQNVCNLILQSGSGYPSNNSKPLTNQDFEILRNSLAQNPETSKPETKEIREKIIKECPKCHETKVEGFPGIEFDEKIGELFGYKQFDPNDPESKNPQSCCRKCRSSQTILSSEKDPATSQELENDTYFRVFDFDEKSLNIKKCKIESIDAIQKDQVLTNDDIVEKFGVGNMGGIRYTKDNSIIVLLSSYSGDYDDSIDVDSGLIVYTGEGKGDQEMKNGNEKILNSKNTPIVFFEGVYQEPGTGKRGALDNKYKFVATVKYQRHYWKTEKGRKVIKFILEVNR